MNYRGMGCLTLKEPFGKDFRLGSGIILVFICSNFRAFSLQILIYVCFMWQIMRLRNTNEEEVDDDLFSLACGPDFRVRKYSTCIVNGVRFNTVDRDKNKKTQNNWVISQSTYNG
jgi:hypothetical protein